MVRLKYEDYTVAWIAVLPIEAVAARLIFDIEHDGHFPITGSDDYIYIGGEVNGHKVVLATLPVGHSYGVGSAAALAANVRTRFPNVRFALLVGVAAGVPNLSPKPSQKPLDIRFGDVIVCVPDKGSAGVVQYDLGADTEHGFLINGRLAETPAIVRAAIGDIKLRHIKPFKDGNILSTYLKTLQKKAVEAEIEDDFSCPSQEHDRLYESIVEGGTTVQKLVVRPLRDENYRTHIWYGRIGSGNSLMRNAQRRDKLRDDYNFIGLEMEAAGVTNILPTGVIRGVCDYGDAQKNKEWQPYAAAVAAAYAKGVLCAISSEDTKVRQVIQETKSMVIFDQPRPRDPKFVGREKIIGNIDNNFKTGQRVALIGVGGVGKSQVAIEYSYRFAENNPGTCVFWVFAASVLSFSEAYKNIARKLKLPRCDDPNVNALQLVYDWLSCEDHCDWLLILDNVDDEHIFFPRIPSSRGSGGQHGLHLSQYLPQTRGRILITSRNRKAAIQLTNSTETIVDVPRMDLEDARTLLYNKLPSDNSDDVDKAALVEALEYLPLAITQAAAYISARNKRMTIAKYLKIFRNAADQARLLQDDMRDLRRDPSVPNSVITAWEISFEQIKRSSPSAAELLSLMSVLDRQGIPEFLFLGDASCLDFENNLGVLLDFSFITPETGGESFGMHRLVQLATRTWLKRHGEIEKFKNEAIAMLSESFPDGEHENWKICATLNPHAEVVLGYEISGQTYLLQKAQLLYNTAWYIFDYQANYILANERLQEALDIRLKFLGQEDPEVFGIFGFQASVLEKLGQFTEAEAMDRQTLAITEKVLGPEHPDTLISMSNLAMVLEKQGKFTEAEAMDRQTLAIKEKVLGPKHPDTLISMSNLALVLQKQGKFTEAEAMDRQTLAIREKVLGPKHPDTLISMSNLALVLGRQGKFTEAETLNRQTIALKEKVLGLEHPETLVSLWGLAYILQKQEQYDGSSELYEKACVGYERCLGPDHPDTIECLECQSDMLAQRDAAQNVRKIEDELERTRTSYRSSKRVGYAQRDVYL